MACEPAFSTLGGLSTAVDLPYSLKTRCFREDSVGCRLTHYNIGKVLTIRQVLLCALRHEEGCTMRHYGISDLLVEEWLERAHEEGPELLPRRILSFLPEVQDAGIRDVLEEVHKMPAERGCCHLVANKIYHMIEKRMGEADTDIRGNYIVKVRADSIGWEGHIINVFTALDKREEGKLAWYAVDKNTNSLLFPGCSESQLHSRLRGFYHLSSTFPREQRMGISQECFTGWEKELPEWKVSETV